MIVHILLPFAVAYCILAMNSLLSAGYLNSNTIPTTIHHNIIQNGECIADNNNNNHHTMRILSMSTDPPPPGWDEDSYYESPRPSSSSSYARDHTIDRNSYRDDDNYDDYTTPRDHDNNPRDNDHDMEYIDLDSIPIDYEVVPLPITTPTATAGPTGPATPPTATYTSSLPRRFIPHPNRALPDDYPYHSRHNDNNNNNEDDDTTRRSHDTTTTTTESSTDPLPPGWFDDDDDNDANNNNNTSSNNNNDNDKPLESFNMRRFLLPRITRVNGDLPILNNNRPIEHPKVNNTAIENALTRIEHTNN